MRPQSLQEFIGQEKLLGKGKLLHSMLESGILPSLILWGPPGTGKTTLARILARSTAADFVYFSAVLSGVKEVRKIVEQAEKLRDKEKKEPFSSLMRSTDSTKVNRMHFFPMLKMVFSP